MKMLSSFIVTLIAVFEKEKKIQIPFKTRINKTSSIFLHCFLFELIFFNLSLLKNKKGSFFFNICKDLKFFFYDIHLK